jgi:peptidoglycan/xylan/chitin deacetylase (PgdA/CDA1 family)
MLQPILFASRIRRFMRTGSIRSGPYLRYRDYLSRVAGSSDHAFFNLTIDLELGWSRTRGSNSPTPLAESLRRGRLARERVPDLLELCADLTIPLTFAVVGHVAISDCRAHRPPPAFAPYWLGHDWFAVDPRSSLSESEEFYGEDLVRQIMQNRVVHEVASHGFSHLDLGDDATTEEAARFEIDESFRILSTLGLPPATFVFPGNRPGFVHLVKQHGFFIYRSQCNARLAIDALGLWQFPLGFWLSPRAVSPEEVIDLVDTAIERKALVNFYCHLYEFGSRQSLINFFRPVFAYVRKNECGGRIEARTMRSIVEMSQRRVL